MTKKNYERAAEIVRRMYADPTDWHATVVREAFVTLFKVEPRFNVERFRRACEPRKQDPHQ